MPEPAAARAIEEAERALGITFPDDYRAWLSSVNGLEGFFGPVYVALWPLAQVVEMTAAYHLDHDLPGAVVIGSDGGGEAVVYDFRDAPPRLALANFVSAGWHEAIQQAGSFSEFMEQRSQGRDFVWEDPA